MTMMCKTHNKPLQDGFCGDCLSAVSPVQSEPLLASLSTLIEKWRTERDFLATGTGSDRTIARLYDECAQELSEIVRPNEKVEAPK